MLLNKYLLKTHENSGAIFRFIVKAFLKVNIFLCFMSAFDNVFIILFC